MSGGAFVPNVEQCCLCRARRGFANEPGEKFCGGGCTSLTVVEPTPEPRFATPASYTPKHLAEKILTSRQALEGERKQVTVLFCDLANSTPLATRLGPERMHRLLNQFFELALDEVHRYEGTINQFLVTVLWRCLGHLLPMKITPDGPYWLRWVCASGCTTTRTRCASSTAQQ